MFGRNISSANGPVWSRILHIESDEITEIRSNEVVCSARASRAVAKTKRRSVFNLNLTIEAVHRKAKENVSSNNSNSNDDSRQKIFSIEREGAQTLENKNPAIFTCLDKEVYVNEKLMDIDQKRIIQHKDLIELKSFNKIFRFSDDRQMLKEEISKEIKELYYVQKTIGSGVNGNVHLAHDIWTFEKFAMKTVYLDDDENEKEVDMEIKIMQMACHENVLKIMGVVDTPEKSHLMLEYMDQGDLLKFIRKSKNKRLSENQTKFAMTQVTRGLEHLHLKGISHLDLKLDNILVHLKRGVKVYKIADFGFSVIGEITDSTSGTPNYYPPEIFFDGVEDHSGFKRDMWALGIVTYFCLYGFYPFDFGPSMEKQFKKAEVPFDSKTISTSKNAKQLIRSLCTFEPEERLSCSEVLRHPWIFNDKNLKERLMDLERALKPKSRAEDDIATNHPKQRRLR